MVWKGVIVEESLENRDILDKVTEVGYAESFLEEEEDKGVMHFHQFEISDDKKDWFVETAKKCIQHGWYIHICKDGVMIVIFRDKSFEFSANEKEKTDAAINYGLSVGIIMDQMPFEELIKDPFY